jgi:hypothetical protein
MKSGIWEEQTMSKKWIILIVLALSLLLTVSVLAADTVERWVLGGGGGRLEQGNTTLEFTVGQWVAGSSTNGSTQLDSGFWFERACYSLSTSVDPAGAGTIQLDPAPNCGSQYLEGTYVTLTAVSNPGYVVDHWSGDVTGTENPVQLIIDGDKSVTAHFRASSLPCYPLTTSAIPTAGGEVIANPAPNCVDQYEEGTTVSLNAVANPGYLFSFWSGDVSGGTNPVDIEMDAAKSVGANFIEWVGDQHIYLPLITR